MRRSLSFFVLVLVTAAWVRDAVGAVTVSPGAGCPSSDAIVAHLERLGARSLFSQLGDAEVRIEEPSLRVQFRDRRGEPLGARVVTATTDCESRAALAAAVIAAFAGEWAQTALAAPAAPPARPATAPATPPWRSEVGAMAFAVHDGDEGGFGLGMRADLGRGPWLLSVLAEGSLAREQPLGSGHGAYRFLRAGLGLGVRRLWSRVFWDATLLPMVDRLALAGQDLGDNRTVTSWGFAMAGQTRIGWGGWRVRPFLFAGASYRVPGEWMTLEDRPEVRVPLSAVNGEVGLGLSVASTP